MVAPSNRLRCHKSGQKYGPDTREAPMWADTLQLIGYVGVFSIGTHCTSSIPTAGTAYRYVCAWEQVLCDLHWYWLRVFEYVPDEQSEQDRSDKHVLFADMYVPGYRSVVFTR